MHFARGDVGTKSFHPKMTMGLPSGAESDALRLPKVNFREIFGADRFSTFATVSARTGLRHKDAIALQSTLDD